MEKTRIRPLRVVVLASLLAASASAPVAWMQGAPQQAPTGFDGLTNGHLTQAVFDINEDVFAENETIEDGLGPLFNATGCASCHQTPVVGGVSQFNELRAGHFNGTTFVDHPGGSLINDQSINVAIQESVQDGNEVRTFRQSLNVLGDGFVESIADQTFTNIRATQPAGFVGTIIRVPVIEANNALAIARFGWKNQHASLISFAGDAYLNEMGITNLVRGFRAFAVENTSLGRSVAAYDTVADPEDDGEDIEIFAEFMRSTKAPPRGPITAQVTRGEQLFTAIACNLCHTPNITTAPAGTRQNAGTFTVTAALGNKVIHPFSDFMLHDVGTGDGIVQNGGQATRNMLRTPPLWGVRTRSRFMHDGQSFTLAEAVLRHGGSGGGTFASNNFRALSPQQKADLVAFLKSL